MARGLSQIATANIHNRHRASTERLQGVREVLREGMHALVLKVDRDGTSAAPVIHHVFRSGNGLSIVGDGHEKSAVISTCRRGRIDDANHEGGCSIALSRIGRLSNSARRKIWLGVPDHNLASTVAPRREA